MKYETPKIDVIELNNLKSRDIITLSPGGAGDGNLQEGDWSQ